MPRLRNIVCKPTRPVPCSVVALDGETKYDFALRLLPSSDTRDAAQRAREYAKKYGVADPKSDDVLYLRGLWVNTLLLACVDPDGTPDSPTLYFDSIEQIERVLDDARIVYVYQAWRDHQLEYAPNPEGVSPEKYIELVAASVDEWRAGGDPERPFVGLPSRTLRNLAAQLVFQSFSLEQILSQLGSLSPGDTSSSASSAPPSGEPS